MIWPFNRSGRNRIIQSLRQQRDEAEDDYVAVSQRLAASESAMRNMQKAMTDEGLDAISKAATAEIADIYAGHRGGVKARDAAVYAVIHREVRKAALGEAAWNIGRIAHEAYRD